MDYTFVVFPLILLLGVGQVCQSLEAKRAGGNGAHHFTVEKDDVRLSRVKRDITDLHQQHLSRSARRRRDAADARCNQQETTFLNELKKNETGFSHLHTFQNETKFTLSLTWSMQPNNEPSIIVVVTHEYLLGMFAQKSTVYRSTNDGRSFENIDDKLPGAYIRKDNGIVKNPLNPSKVILVAHPDHEGKFSHWITEDGGDTWTKIKSTFQLINPMIFHPKQENWILTLDNERNLYLTVDMGKTWKMIKDKVVKFKWALENGDKIIYCLHDVAMQRDIFGRMSSSSKEFTLLKTTDLGVQWEHILENVYTFGSEGKFVYASMFVNGNRDQRKMKVSTTEGRIWNEVQLPTITADRFYSILDMSEGLIFMHVDAPGDTGHGTIYTSDSSGIIFSESLDRHLYPNFEDVTDFYRVQSLPGVYIASQLNTDNSIHTVITFDRGAVWQSIRRPPGAPCHDESKPCYLQIHNQYSIVKHINAQPPLSIPGAPGIVLAHGHVAASLQTSPPDVYVSSDGGYNWIKALDGPHHYLIADSGGLLVAVSSSTRTPNTVKFSTDEGRCWHSYKFTNETLMFTGLLSEPRNTAMHVNIWGYGPDHIWKAHLIDFSKVIPNACDPTKDYEKWMAHSELSRGMDVQQQGCLLGKKHTFYRLKLDSWCRNGGSYEPKKETSVCPCHQDDYECDFGYHRPVNSQDCVKRPGETEIVCLKGHEETIKSTGYRKIPGDVCQNGVSPGRDQYINMLKACNGQKFTQVNVEKESDTKTNSNTNTGVVIGGNNNMNSGIHVGGDGTNAAHVGPSSSPPASGVSRGVVVFVSIISVIFGLVLAGLFVRKYLASRRRDVTYKYSLLSQQHGEDYDNDLENALSTDTALYNDSEEEVDSSRLGNGTVMGRPSTTGPQSALNGTARHIAPPSNMNGVGAPKTKQYHDDSDDDLLE